MVDFAPSCVVEAPSSLAVTVERFPAGNVLPGEPVLLWVTGETNFTGSDVRREMNVDWDLGNSGAVYRTGGGRTNNANEAGGRVVVAQWSTPGAKTITVTPRTTAGGPGTPLSIPVTVDDVSARTWTHKIYYSQTFNFTGADPETGNVSYASTASAVTALINSGDDVHLVLRKGETYSVSPTDTIIMNDDNIRVYQTIEDGYGTGAAPEFVASNPGGGWSFYYAFNMGGGANTHLHLTDCTFTGGYDPVTGIGTDGTFVPVFSLPTSLDTDVHSVSAVRVDCGGCMSLIGGAGNGGETNGRMYSMLIDCILSDWGNYGSDISSGKSRSGLAGCHFLQDPLAIRRDAKINTLPQSADHGCWRINGCEMFCAIECTTGNSSGWSPYGLDKFIQPIFRLYPQQSGGQEVNLWNTRGAAATFVAIGRHSPNDNSVPLHPGWLTVEGCELLVGPQTFGAIASSISGIYVRNNNVYWSNTHSEQDPANFLGVLKLEGANYSSLTPGALTRPIVIEFNTIVSDRSADSGGLTNFDLVLYDNSQATWTGPTPIVENNVVVAPNHANGGSFDDFGQISRGDDFKLVSGTGTQSQAVSSGNIPVYDYSGNLRGAVTTVGAHHDTVVSASAVSPPVNTALPQIAALTGFTDEVAVSDFGTWNNIDVLERYLFNRNWKVNGSEVTNNDLTILDTSAVSGTGTADVIATNLSGQRVTAVSPGLAV